MGRHGRRRRHACAMRAIALLKAPIRVVGVVPATENMPGGARSSREYSQERERDGGRVSTDAEVADSGRRTVSARSGWARHTSSMSRTLTGACVVALGKITKSGLFGMNEWVERVRRVIPTAPAIASGRCRCSTSTRSLKAKSPTRRGTADVAGSITAALFLKGSPASPLGAHRHRGHRVAGEALSSRDGGVGVRALAELAFTKFDV